MWPSHIYILCYILITLLVTILYRIPWMSKVSHVEGLIPMWVKHTVGILLFTNKLSRYIQFQHPLFLEGQTFNFWLCFSPFTFADVICKKLKKKFEVLKRTLNMFPCSLKMIHIFDTIFLTGINVVAVLIGFIKFIFINLQHMME